jgi:hypothetical protein
MEFKRDYCGLIVFFLIDIAFAIWWIRMRLGLDKRWFVVPAAPLISRGFYFALPTFVVGFAIVLLTMLLFFLDPEADLVFPLVAAWGLWGMGFIFAYFEPEWLSPAWYRWLKKEHGDILPYLAEEAHQLGRKKWLKQVQTQEDLERWAEEVRRKYTLENH